jgi:hypothetical protein
MPKPNRKSKVVQTVVQTTDATLSLKERLAQKRKAAKARKEAINYLSMSAGLAIVAAIILFAVAGIKGAIGGFIGIWAMLLSFKFPWLALHAFLIYMPFSGTVIYSLGGNNPLLQLAKDGIFIPALIGIVQYCKQKRYSIVVPKELKTPTWLLLAYCVLVLLFVNGSQQVMGSGSDKPIAMGILGLKVLLGYLPLIPCAYYMMQRKQDVYWLLRITAIVVVICCGLGFTQYMFLKTGRCQGTTGVGAELFKASLEARCLVGGSLLYTPEQGVIRLPGTFVAPWQWGWFLISSAFISFAVTFFDRNLLWKLIGILAMIGTIVMAVVSGQRIALILVPLLIGVQLITTGQVANLKRFLLIGIALAFVLTFAMASNPAVVQERWNSAVGRWSAAPPDAFIKEQFHQVSDGAGLLGRGLGRATNSARALGETKLIETYYPKLMFEIGPIGVLLFLGLVTTITKQCFKAYRSVKDQTLRGYGAVFWTFVLFISYNTYYYPLDVDPVAVYYWFFAGVVLKLPELDKQEIVSIEEPKTKRRR